MNHQFSSPLAAVLFEMGRANLQEQLKQANQGVPHHPLSESEVDFLGELDEANSNRPVTLPTASQADIDDEIGRIARRRHPAPCHEL